MFLLFSAENRVVSLTNLFSKKSHRPLFVSKKSTSHLHDSDPLPRVVNLNPLLGLLDVGVHVGVAISFAPLFAVI